MFLQRGGATRRPRALFRIIQGVSPSRGSAQVSSFFPPQFRGHSDNSPYFDPELNTMPLRSPKSVTTKLPLRTGVSRRTLVPIAYTHRSPIPGRGQSGMNRQFNPAKSPGGRKTRSAPPGGQPRQSAWRLRGMGRQSGRPMERPPAVRPARTIVAGNPASVANELQKKRSPAVVRARVVSKVSLTVPGAPWNGPHH